MNPRDMAEKQASLASLISEEVKDRTVSALANAAQKPPGSINKAVLQQASAHMGEQLRSILPEEVEKEFQQLMNVIIDRAPGKGQGPSTQYIQLVKDTVDVVFSPFKPGLAERLNDKGKAGREIDATMDKLAVIFANCFTKNPTKDLKIHQEMDDKQKIAYAFYEKAVFVLAATAANPAQVYTNLVSSSLIAGKMKEYMLDASIDYFNDTVKRTQKLGVLDAIVQYPELITLKVAIAKSNVFESRDAKNDYAQRFGRATARFDELYANFMESSQQFLKEKDLQPEIQVKVVNAAIEFFSQHIMDLKNKNQAIPPGQYQELKKYKDAITKNPSFKDISHLTLAVCKHAVDGMESLPSVRFDVKKRGEFKRQATLGNLEGRARINDGGLKRQLSSAKIVRPTPAPTPETTPAPDPEPPKAKMR